MSDPIDDAPCPTGLAALHRLIAHHREFPDAYGLGDAFAALVVRWRPGTVQAHR